MVKVRTAKSKGNQHEYYCQYSLGKVYGQDNVTRTSERGYQLQYDLKVDLGEGKYLAVECKREAGFSWNKLKKYFEKLESVTPDAEERCLLFKANQQPCLVMYRSLIDRNIQVLEFEDLFGVIYEKHPSTRSKK